MEELSVIQITYEIHKKLAELNATLNQTYRHTLSEPAVRHMQATLGKLILAKHAPKSTKKPYLVQAEAEAELTALLLRTMLELHLANETNLLKLQAKLTNARRQISGWRKSVN
jgi:hypothetical protein